MLDILKDTRVGCDEFFSSNYKIFRIVKVYSRSRDIFTLPLGGKKNQLGDDTPLKFSVFECFCMFSM